MLYIGGPGQRELLYVNRSPGSNCGGGYLPTRAYGKSCLYEKLFITAELQLKICN